jgi:hypothetical protein
LSTLIFLLWGGFTSIWNFDNKLITVAAGVFAKMTCTKISITWINHEFFGTKLPLIPGSAEEAAGQASINKHRIQYLLWNQYQLFDPELILSPSHQDLIWLSEMVSDFLSDRFKNLPLGSGVKTFISQPNEYCTSRRL